MERGLPNFAHPFAWQGIAIFVMPFNGMGMTRSPTIADPSNQTASFLPPPRRFSELSVPQRTSQRTKTYALIVKSTRASLFRLRFFLLRLVERTFGHVIRDRRRQLDLTQEEVARRIKTATPYVGYLESGKRHPSDKIVARLAEVLGLDRHELFFLANPRARAILGAEPDTNVKSAWEDFRKENRLRRIHNISSDEMEMIERCAILASMRKIRK